MYLRSTLQELRSLFEQDITAQHIASRLVCCPASHDAIVLKQQMKSKDFDVYGIEEDGMVDGYVQRTELSGGDG